MKLYLCVLGRNRELSLVELQMQSAVLDWDISEGLAVVKNINTVNPRELPKTPEQCFLDRLGGTIRMGEIIATVDESEIFSVLTHQIQSQKTEGKIHLGMTGFGVKKTFVADLLLQIKQTLKNQNRNVRLLNPSGVPLDSGKIFGEKLLKKNGFEFLLWKKSGKFFVAQTIANQNLWNYTIRDREKPFRDAYMGMLPPKLAQILINLSSPSDDDVIYDPFCGSGTVNIEAVLNNFYTKGSDLSTNFIKGARSNAKSISDRFRLPLDFFSFSVADATKISWSSEKKGVVCSEGFLGKNFSHPPSSAEIFAEKKSIQSLLTAFFQNLDPSIVPRVVICLPAWKKPSGYDSIFVSLASRIKNYQPILLWKEKKSLFYDRPGQFVAREVTMWEGV